MTAQISPISVPLTNGVVRSFGHVRLKIAGLEFTGGFKSIKRSRKRSREMVRSNSPDPVGKTLGDNEYECSAVVYFDWWANLLQTVQQNLGPGYGDQAFTIYISYVGKNLVNYTDVIVNCTFDSTEADDQTGTAALTREINFAPTKIYFACPGGLLIDDLEDPLEAPQQ
jgi:hypothetical protein